MALIVIPNIFTVGQVIVASAHNANFSVISTDYNGNITNANISGSADISDIKLGNITTAGKVSGAALTSLASIPSGAGAIPSANLTTVVLLTGTQTVAGAKTFSSTIIGNLTGNVTGTLTGSVVLNGGTITGGTLGVNDQLSHSMANNETFMIPAGYYMNGVKRGSGGEIDTVYYAKL